jgi:hypothetical protein
LSALSPWLLRQHYSTRAHAHSPPTQKHTRTLTLTLPNTDTSRSSTSFADLQQQESTHRPHASSLKVTSRSVLTVLARRDRDRSGIGLVSIAATEYTPACTRLQRKRPYLLPTLIEDATRAGVHMTRAGTLEWSPLKDEQVPPVQSWLST